MYCRGLFLAIVTVMAAPLLASAGSVYKITSREGDATITYEVRFGGGRLMDQYTAYDPETKRFVYLQWRRDGEKPTPVMKIWDHRTGETLLLYRFPDSKHPLPIIPSLKAMKVCPRTGDRAFKAKLHMLFD